MNKTWLALSTVALAGALGVGAYFDRSEASDHDDGDNDIKSRALNLTDHFAFKSGSDLTLIMYVNPRSLPGKGYFLSTGARYEFHVSRAASKTTAPTVKSDFVFRFVAEAPDDAGVQKIALTVFKDGAVLGTHDGTSTSYAKSKNDQLTENDAPIAGVMMKYFVGMRADSFYFDVNRFFQVRTFLATRFFGGAGGIGVPIGNGAGQVTLAPNCEGDNFLDGVGGDGDGINLFNPPSCAPDFTKNLNVTAIVLNVPISALGGQVFDTWSTISVKP
jgi:hypothetical protein